jgi:hypothetical protein
LDEGVRYYTNVVVKQRSRSSGPYYSLLYPIEWCSIMVSDDNEFDIAAHNGKAAPTCGTKLAKNGGKFSELPRRR